MIRTIPKVVSNRAVDPRQLGWLSDKRATTRSNFPANFEYVDLRGATLERVDLLLAEERDGYAYLEANRFDDAAVDEIDGAMLRGSALPMLDFGVARRSRRALRTRLRAGDELPGADARPTTAWRSRRR